MPCLFAKCTWWCCRMVMAALTTIQWALNTKCSKYWAAWQTEPAGLQWNVRAGLCLMFSNPSHILSKEFQPWSFLMWKQLCPLNQLCKTSHSTTMFPSDREQNLHVQLRKMGTHLPAVSGPPAQVHAGFIKLFWLQELFWAGMFSVQWGAAMNR